MAEIGQIKRVDINDLKPYEYNSKKHPEKQLKQLEASIAEFGFISPVLIDKDNNIIAGHGRTMAAQALGLHEVPCVRIEGLTDEQRRAYIIADNRLTELGGWDKDILANELSVLDIEEFNVDLTGFNITDINALNLRLEQPYGAERNRTIETYNMGLLSESDMTADFWQMPVINNDECMPTALMGFNYAKSSENKQTGIHFFVDDYQFERVWNAPDKYIDILSDYECILSPDFSLYMDMPMPMKIWNIYRSRFIGAYYQSKGIKVIPTISWAEPETFQFCFQGIPKGSTVAVSTIGVKESDEAFKIWEDDMKAMIEEIEPKTIIVYGGQLDFDYGNINVKYFDNQVLKNWKEKEHGKS